MKKNLLLLHLLIVFISSTVAQNVMIPNANFKAKLIALGVDTNGDGQIQLTEAQVLTSLDISNSNISNLMGIEAFTGLNNLDCSGNQLTSLDVSQNINLVGLVCSDNQLTSLDVSQNVNLYNLWCHNNQLTSLDVSQNVNLYNLWCHNNQLTSLDVSNSVNLNNLWCYNNQLTSLDVSNSVNLDGLWCYNNQLASLNIKNGNANTYTFLNNPNLQYICVDSMELLSVIFDVQQAGMTGVMVNTLCTYAPSGNYNTISGPVLTDFDLNTCSSSDPKFPFIPIVVKKGAATLGYILSNQAGNYITYVDTGNFSLTPLPTNPAYYTGNASNVAFANNNNNILNQDICVELNGVYPDVEITLIPLDAARPGFNAQYKIQYKNNGTTLANGVITYDFLSNKMSFVSASTAPTSQTANQISWVYSNLMPLEVRTIDFTMNVFPPPTNNINDTLGTFANISLANDFNLSDNVFSLNQILVGAFDPNDKTCLEGNLLNNTKIGEYLHYMIRFQNTGNYPADYVVIIDTLDDTKYDLQSLQMIETSHDCHIDLWGKVLQFYFENIQLADSFSNEPESHGYVVFKIKTKNTLPQNVSVSNKAEIYFDFNPPIITNVATTTFANIVSIDTEAPLSFRCYPNPAQNSLTVETQTPQNLTILNAMGKTIQTLSVVNKQEIDISTLTSGIYYLKNEHSGVSFVKE